MSSVMKGARVRPSSWWKWCFTELDDRYKCWKELPPEGDAPILSQGDKIQMVLSDLSLYAADVTLQARSKKKIIEPLRILEGEDKLKVMLRQAFGLVYTRANVMLTPAYLACHVLLVPSLHIAAIVLFATSQKQKQKQQGYNNSSSTAADIKTTYILLCLTAVLDILGVLISKLCDSLMFRANVPVLCQKLIQYNLMDSVLGQTRTTTGGWLVRCARRLISFDLEGRYSGEEKDQSLYRTVSDFITAELVRVAEEVANADFSSYRSFNSMYWSDTKKKLLLKTSYYSTTTAAAAAAAATATSSTDDDQLMKTKIGNFVIWRSLRQMPFDASVLIWHIATDLCFRSRPPKHFSCRHQRPEVAREVCTKAISNYMAYLLNFQPDMLMTGSRKHLFTEATKCMARILTKDMTKDQKQQPLCDEMLLDRIKQHQGSRLKEEETAYTVIADAWKLTEELLRIEDDDDRWNLMYRVWVGMLCYSASMCRGYLHAKRLGGGGEFLSYVWLIISLKGAKTLADTLQMPDKEPGDDVWGEDGEIYNSYKPKPPQGSSLDCDWLSPL